MRVLAVTLISITSFINLSSLNIDNIILNHPLYLSADAQVEAAKIGLEKEYMFYYPFDGNLELENNSYINNPEMNMTIGFSLSYKVFNPDMTKNLKNKEVIIKTSEEYRESIYQLLNYKINRLVLLYRNSLKIYEQTKTNYESIESYTLKLKERFTTGDLSKSEMSFAESVLYKNKAILIDSEDAVKKSLRLLSSETGTDNLQTEIEHEFDIKMDDDIEKIIMNDPQVKQLSLVLINTRNNIGLTRSNTIPDITVKTSVNFPIDSESYWNAGVDISIPMFGIKYDSYIRDEYRKEIDNKESQLEVLVREKRSRIENTSKRIESVTEKLKLYRTSLQLSQTSLNGILAEAKAGVRTVFDVIETTNSVSDISKYIIESENELSLLKLEYIYLTGGLKSNGY